MFYNNMAAESLVNGDLDRAYALVKAGVKAGQFIPALNTLAVIYRHEFFFGISQTYWALGDKKRAQLNMEKAMVLSRSGTERYRYQAKLEAMKHH